MHTVKPPIKDTPKEDKPPSKGHTICTLVYTLYKITSERGQPLYKGQMGGPNVHYSEVPLYMQSEGSEAIVAIPVACLVAMYSHHVSWETIGSKQNRRHAHVPNMSISFLPRYLRKDGKRVFGRLVMLRINGS